MFATVTMTTMLFLVGRIFFQTVLLVLYLRVEGPVRKFFARNVKPLAEPAP
ncbi:hypothetical protein [Thermococcus celer]|uniref:hypothetical protein n=1 Tax=Thermococcus celer TaxID=2264 RepID=UPI0012FFA7EF|nr:hypothetical protein [Thermococcus celer]